MGGFGTWCESMLLGALTVATTVYDVDRACVEAPLTYGIREGRSARMGTPRHVG